MQFKTIITVLLTMSIIAPVFSGIAFPNPSFDEDAANIGAPDGWDIHQKAVVTLVTDKVSHGAKAAKFTDGYVLLSCNMKEENIAGLKISGSIDAAGIDGAQLGVMFGYNVSQDGKEKFVYSQPVWNRKLEADYKKISFSCVIPANAVKERVWFGVYRSNSQGTVYLDNAAIQAFRGADMTAEEIARQTELKRDWEYLQSRLAAARKRLPANPELPTLEKAVADALDRIVKGQLEPPPGNYGGCAAAINRILSGNAELAAWFSDPYVRLDLNSVIPAQPRLKMELPTLLDEYQALGVTLTNNLSQARTVPVVIDGLEQFAEDIRVRRQVLMKNWYEREKSLTADPLTLLPGRDNRYELALEPGEPVSLYIGFKVRKGIAGGVYPLTLQIAGEQLEAALKVIPRDFPHEITFSNLQCLYPELGAPGKHPDLAAKDLAEHYTTVIEFPYLPDTMIFNPDGTIKSKQLEKSRHARWLEAYASRNITLALFWEGYYKRFPVDRDGKREVMNFVDENNQLTPEWRNAYVNALRAWLEFAASRGYGVEHFQMWGMDELASKEEFADAPGAKVKLGIEIYKLLRANFPELPLMVTAGNYTLPQDVRAYIDHVDVVNQAWPMPEKLTRWAPATYKPNEEFLNDTLPFLLRRPKLFLGSYRVDAGKKEPVLNSGRAYPICAVGLGFSGVGTWAYNCSRGLTWDDTDKGLLDYIMVYDGTEDHPLNRRYNVVNEEIVPSIRWEALRMGIQDAKIMLLLKERMERGDCPPAVSAELKKLLAQAGEYGRKLNYDEDGINTISRKLRDLINEIK